MAELLKRQYDLFVLKLMMDTSGGEIVVRCKIEGSEEHDVTLLDDWACPADEIGLPRSLDRSMSRFEGLPFQVPGDWIGRLQAALAEREDAQAPLWIHLVKPYGYLGLVPWERLLQPKLGVAILRLPDFLARPVQHRSSRLDVILCGSLPRAKQAFAMVDHLDHMAHRILAVVPRRVRLHVFVDREWYPQLRAKWQDEGLVGEPIRIYDPEQAAVDSLPERTTRMSIGPVRVENPWLLWMRNALAGQAVDVAHFVCHGFMSGDLGALSFSESPVRNEDTRMARFVGVQELCAFLTQVGAWSAAFGSPENNYSEMGLRCLADSLAQLRAGPVLHHEIARDPGYAVLEHVYRFLYGPAYQPPPASPALFLYCHPGRVAEGAGKAARASALDATELESLAAPAAEPLASIYAEDEDVPSWVAATERHLEQRAMQLEVNSRGSSARSAKRGSADSQGTIQDTLRRIQDVVAKAARSRSGEGS